MNQRERPDVSRETFERLELYAALLQKWNPSINLVSRASLGDLWSRHILDSVQIFEMAGHPVGHWVDLGSGGGFPGLVMAIMAKEAGSPTQVTLVESDTRKCTFLRTVIRETGVQAEVINDRIENVAPLAADVLSARALSNLTTLLAYADRHLKPDGIAIFPKGETWRKELEEARAKWCFQYEFAQSKTETGPVILRISGVSRV